MQVRVQVQVGMGAALAEEAKSKKPPGALRGRHWRPRSQ